MIKQRHVRVGDGLGDDETIVIRGGRLDPEVLRAAEFRLDPTSRNPKALRDETNKRSKGS